MNNKQIRAAMIAVEREVITHLRRKSRTPYFTPLFASTIVCSPRWRKAIDRLEKKGRIKFSKGQGYILA